MEAFNNLDKIELEKALNTCCGSTRWAAQMAEFHPFENEAHLFSAATKIWFEQCNMEDWLEAFSCHPKIGDVANLAKKFAATKDWSSSEQAGVQVASLETLQALAEGNQAYEEKFGYIFIVCATEKSAEEMLSLLSQRLENEPENEIHIAMQEQAKITEIRLKKLLA